LFEIVIFATQLVKGYTRFVGKYVRGRRNRFRLHKVYMYILNQDPSRVDLAMSVCPSIRMSPEILEIRARMLGLSVQILWLLAQRQFVRPKL